MAVYDLEEQEQISEIKAWWAENGKLVTAVVLAAAIGSVGWQGLRWYQDKQASEAGAIYFAVQEAVEHSDAAKAREAAGKLIERFGDTSYAQMAALMSAKVQFAGGDTKNARAPLEWLISQGSDPALKDIARLRLATILLHEGAYADALAQLDGASVPSLKPRYEDLRGDVLAMDGKIDQARAAYQSALDALAGGQIGDPLRDVIRLKLESLES